MSNQAKMTRLAELLEERETLDRRTRFLWRLQGSAEEKFRTILTPFRGEEERARQQEEWKKEAVTLLMQMLVSRTEAVRMVSHFLKNGEWKTAEIEHELHRCCSVIIAMAQEGVKNERRESNSKEQS